MSATKIGSRLLSRCCEKGLDEAWLKSIQGNPRVAKGSKMSNSAIQVLAGVEAITPNSRTKGAVTVWGPGKNYDALMKRLEGRA